MLPQLFHMAGGSGTKRRDFSVFGANTVPFCHSVARAPGYLEQPDDSWFPTIWRPC